MQLYKIHHGSPSIPLSKPDLQHSSCHVVHNRLFPEYYLPVHNIFLLYRLSCKYVDVHSTNHMLFHTSRPA